MQAAEEALMARKEDSFHLSSTAERVMANEKASPRAMGSVQGKEHEVIEANATAITRLSILQYVGIMDETDGSNASEEIHPKESRGVAQDKRSGTTSDPNACVLVKKVPPACKSVGPDEESSGHDEDTTPPLRLAPGIRLNPSVPGAHRANPTWRGEDVPSPPILSNEATLLIGVGEGHELASPEVQSPEEEGLVTADPVHLSPEPAEPIDVEEQVEIQQQKREQMDRMAVLKCVMLGFLVLALAGTGLAVGLSVTIEKSSPSVTLEEGGLIITASPAPTQWAWDLPFAVPNTTLYTIQRDTRLLTPQSKAYLWMKRDPYLSTYSEARLLQRFAMATIYFASGGEQWTNDGGGITTVVTDVTATITLATQGIPSRTRNAPSQGKEEGKNALVTNSSIAQVPSGCCVIGSKPPRGKETKLVNITSEQWLSFDSSECEWFSDAQIIGRTVCNNNSELVFLGLKGNNLQGTLPEEIGLLSSLDQIGLHRNKMEGPIIQKMGHLRNLTAVHMGDNFFTGTVPSEIGLLSNLGKFAMMHNQLTGTLPKEFWSLSNLWQLKVDDQQGLSGSIPSDVGDLMPKLKLFMASLNSFTGTLPYSLGKATNLVRLSVSQNSFSGAIPTELGLLANVTILHLSDNLFTGSIPTQLGQLFSIVDLRFDRNPGIVGPLPSELWKLTQLKVLQLEGTSLSGSIPDAYCGIQYLSFDCSPTLCGCACPC